MVQTHSVPFPLFDHSKVFTACSLRWIASAENYIWAFLWVKNQIVLTANVLLDFWQVFPLTTIPSFFIYTDDTLCEFLHFYSVFFSIFVYCFPSGHVWITVADVWEFASEEQIRLDVSKAKVLDFDHYGELMCQGSCQPQQGALWMYSQWLTCCS